MTLNTINLNQPRLLFLCKKKIGYERQIKCLELMQLQRRQYNTEQRHELELLLSLLVSHVVNVIYRQHSYINYCKIYQKSVFYIYRFDCNTEGAIINGQSRETGNIEYTRRRKTKQKHNTTNCIGHLPYNTTPCP